MKVKGEQYRSLWVTPDGMVDIIDQTELPFLFQVRRITDMEEAAEAITEMMVRGAPLIGVMAAYGVCLALRHDPSNKSLLDACEKMIATRPTAVNIKWAVGELCKHVLPFEGKERVIEAYKHAQAMADADVATNKAIGEHGLTLIEEIAAQKGPDQPVNILTHCNAGWLATIDWGTALAPIYMAHQKGIKVHVWVDETRPRNQGALTAYELENEGVPHHYIVDNAGGYLMQHGKVDLVLVGTDRTLANGDVFNKIGTYLKALAAYDCQVPFYVAAPSSSIDFTHDDASAVKVEMRHGSEVAMVRGVGGKGVETKVVVVPGATPVANPGFDCTPAKLVTGLITERGICAASREGLVSLFPDKIKL